MKTNINENGLSYAVLVGMSTTFLEELELMKGLNQWSSKKQETPKEKVNANRHISEILFETYTGVERNINVVCQAM